MNIASAPIPVLPVADLGRASKFYETTLEFKPTEDQLPDGMFLQAGDGQIFLYETPNVGMAKHTQVAWFVNDLRKEVNRLEMAGVTFETFEAPDMKWQGVVATHKNLRSAWFKDTEGNTLCLNQRLG
jgi:predicted enzyme related to lactoylglutathione lyase